MATTPALTPSRFTLQTRGAWSARDDRTPSAVWLAILWVGMITGFSVDFPHYLGENPPAPWIVHVHAAIYTVWMLLLTTQVLLVVRDRVALHRRLGWVLVAWAALMGIMGPVAILSSDAVNLNNPGFNPAFVAIAFENVLCFLSLLAWGVALRKNPAAHRRLMILSSVALADPGFARFSGWLWPHEPASLPVWHFYIFYGNILLVCLMAAWDWHRGRLMRQFVVGAAALLTAEFIASSLYFWPPWKTVATGWVEAWGRHFG